MRLLFTCILAAGLLLLSGLPALCAATATGSDGLRIKADSLDHRQPDDVITASGAVVIEWQGAVLSCDTAAYDRTSQTLTAQGNIVIEKGGDRATGTALTLDLVSGRGELSRGEVFLKQNNMRFAGKTISRAGDDEYAATGGTYTTCDAEVPSWKFGTDETKITLDQYGTAKHVVFYIKDIPVFYFPYAVFPVKRDRQSGFLFPRFGWSGKKGAEADIFYYWAISPSQEATIDLDIQSRRGAGTGLDYRYLRTRGSQGTLGGYLIYDTNQERLRGSIAQTHREIPGQDMSLRTSINMTTDRSFLSDYGEKSGDYNRQSGDSTVGFLKTWSHYALAANLRYTQDYYAPNNRTTLQTLPEITLAAVRRQVPFTPLYFDLDSSAANFYRENGVKGQRLYGFPRLTLVTGLPGYLNLSAYGGIHLRGYNSDSIPAGSTVKGSDGSLLPETGIRLGTSFSRVYDIGGTSLKKLRHELIPELSYLYTPAQDQTRLPVYDSLDRIVHQSILGWSLTSILGGRFRVDERDEYRELMRLRLSQGFSLRGTRRDLLTVVDAGRPWTDLMLESETRLHPQVRLIMDGRFNVYDRQFSSASPGLEVEDKQGNSAALSYRMVRRDVEYLEGRLSTKLLNPLTLGYGTRYSFDSRNFLESVYSVEYRHQCWSIIFSYRDRRGPNASQGFNVSFNLLGAFGVGSAATGLSSR